MNTTEALQKAYSIVGKQPLAEGLGVTYQAVLKWEKNNRMPDTEYSGRTLHAKKIEEITGGQVTISQLLGCVPPHLNVSA